MKFKKFSKEKPKGNINYDIPILCKVHGLSMVGSEYEEYVVLKWREKLQCFIDWRYDCNGNFNSVKWNEPNINKPIGAECVTEWCYLPFL